MRNEEAIAYWEQHGTVPSPEIQAATLAQVLQQNAELTALVAQLQMQVTALATARTKRSAPRSAITQPAAPILTEEERDTEYHAKAIDMHAIETTKRLMALPELAELTREQIYTVVEAHQRGLSARKIREELCWGTGKYTAIIKPVVAALAIYGSSNASAPLPATRQRGNGNTKNVASNTTTSNGNAAEHRQRHRQRKTATV